MIGSAIGAAPHQGINAQAPDTVEGWLAKLPVDAQLVRAEDLAGAIDNAEPRPRRRLQVSNNYTYFHLDPDAVFFLRNITEGRVGILG